jgi:fluoroacetyl-CoA thioesterase
LCGFLNTYLKELTLQDALKPGIEHPFSFRIPANKTVPARYPESPEFQEIPEVFATGFMIGFLEWACIVTLKPYLAWPSEQSLGTHMNVSHLAATPPGMRVTAKVKVTEVKGRRVTFAVAS